MNSMPAVCRKGGHHLNMGSGHLLPSVLPWRGRLAARKRETVQALFEKNNVLGDHRETHEIICDYHPPTQNPLTHYLPCVTSLSRSVSQLGRTPFGLMDCNLPGSSFHGISQIRMLDWVAISYFRGSLQPRD